MQFTTLALATLLSLASTSPIKSRQTSNSNAAFGVMSIRSASPIMYGNLEARGERFYLFGAADTYCPSPPVDCSQFDNSTALLFYGGFLTMDAEVPGGQQVYVMTTGELGFTQAHSASVPEGADLSSFNYDPNAVQSANLGRLSTTAFGAAGFMACQNTEQQWQVFAAIPGKDATNCLGFDALTVVRSTSEPAAWQYT
jgi:hypothetical protein